MKKQLIILAVLAMALMTSCKNGNGSVPERDWKGTTYLFSSQDEPQSETYYKPYSGFVGDPMPYFDPVSKQFIIGYLLDYRPNPAGAYHPIWGVRTKDACHYESIGEMIPAGNRYEQAAAIGTGSMIYSEEQGLYYFFYTGNADILEREEATRQAIHYATSSDLKNWTPCRSFVLRGTDYGYSAADFRDPYVFRDDEGKYHMLVATTNGKNCIAEFTSDNLQKWEHAGIFMTCMWDRFYECPDVFKMGDWWYLVYSEKHVGIRKVQYFKAKSLARLKNCTANDVAIWPDDHEGILDCRGFYAGKTASDGENRYIWGWCPTRKGQDNTETGDGSYEPEWAGTLVAHRLIQHEDGTLTLGEVPAMAAKYNQTEELKVMREDKEANNTLYSRLERHNHISFTAVAENKEAAFGISLCHGTEMNSLKDSSVYYSIQILPEDDKMNYRVKFSQEHGKGICGGVDSYQMPIPEDLTYHVELYTDNSVVVVYVNDQICWTNRIYGQQKNCWGLETFNGSKVEFKDIKVTKY